MAYEEQIGDIQVYSSPMKSLTDKDPIIRIAINSTETFDSSTPSDSSSPRLTEAVAKLKLPPFSSNSIHVFCGSHNVAVPDVCLAAWLMVLAQDGHTASPRAEYIISVDEISTNIVDKSNTNGVLIPQVCQAQLSRGDSALSLVQKVNADRNDLGGESLSHDNSLASSQVIFSLLTFKRISTSAVANARSLENRELDSKASSDSYQNYNEIEGTMHYRASAVLDSLAENLAQNFVKTLGNIVNHHAAVIEDYPKITLGLPASSPSEMSDETAFEEILTEVALQCGVEENLIEDIYPSTSLQEGLIALTIKQPGSYVAQLAFHLPSTLDLGRFRAAWESVVQTRDVLRTRLVNLNSQGTLQVVLDEQLTWDSAERFESYLKMSKIEPMGFGTPLCRYAIVDSYFILTIHHAIYDGWSFQLLFEDVVRAYTREPTLSRVTFQSFLQHLQDMDQEQTMTYWKTQLAGVSGIHFPNGSTSSQIPLPQSILIREVPLITTSRTSMTKASIIRAAWALLISNYTNNDDVVFGETFSGRSVPVPGIEGMIGNTIATLPVRVHVNKNNSITEFLQQVHDQISTMIQYEQIGLQELKKINSDTRTACEFQHIIIIQPEDSWGREFTKLGIQPVSMEIENFYSYALTMEFTILEDGIRLKAAFDNKIVDDLQMNRILNQFENVLGYLQDGVGSATVDSAFRITVQDRMEIDDWHKPLPKPVKECVHKAFMKQARENPSALALSSWDGELTYKELDDLSNKLASKLITRGVKAEVVVPLCFDKSIWVIVSQLAVLKAGGACLTLDTSHPLSRMMDTINEVRPCIILASSTYHERFKGNGADVMIVDETVIQSLPAVNLEILSEVRVTQNNMAFVVFTSGSTGKPKGIMLEHETVCTSSYNHAALFDVGLGSRCLQFSAFAFDVYISDIFTALMYGGCVCIPSEAERRNDLASAIRRLNASQAYLTPTVATLFSPDDVPSLRKVALGGEPFTRENATTWGDKLSLLVNVFGPSETSNWVSYNIVNSNTLKPANIGPGVHVNAWLVDPDNSSQLAPIGCVGELFVEGPILARGYINNPIKTGEAFVTNPPWIEDSNISQRRMYRTGDLVSYNSDGTLNYVGRKDFQIKIRGQRLELGEVEHHLTEAEDVKYSLATLPKSGPCESRLVGILVLHEFSDASKDCTPLKIISHVYKQRAAKKISTICDHIASKLPAWMVPTIWFVVEDFPVSASGKLDRGTVRNWIRDMSAETFETASKLFVDKYITAPTTEAEKQLQKLWRDVLENVALENIGVDSSFLRLGGDSISAMKLVAQARKYQWTLSVGDVFRHSTLGAMASFIATGPSGSVKAKDRSVPFSLVQHTSSLESLRHEAAAQCEVQLDQIENMYPSTALQEGLIALSTKQTGAYVGQHIFALPAHLDINGFISAWNRIDLMYPILRTRLVTTKSSGTLQVAINEPIKWHRPEPQIQTISSYLDKDKAVPMTFGSRLTRFAIVENHFIMTAHHAVYDGWSLPALFEDVISLYQGKEPRVREPFETFIKYLGGLDKTSSNAYWDSQLSGVGVTPFPKLPSPNYQCRGNKSLSREIPIVRSVSGITASTLIRAAWALLVARYTSETEAVFGATISGRSAPVPGIDSMIGPTIATVPLRIKVDPSLSLSEFLVRVQQQSIDMIPFEQAGLQEIGHLSPEARAACQFNNRLIIQPQAEGENELQALGLERIDQNDIESFDTHALTLNCILLENRVRAEAIFDNSVIDTQQIARILNQLEDIIGKIQVESSDTIGSIVKITAQDVEQISNWNTSLPETVDACLHDLIDQKVLEQPDAEAVCSWDGAFSYSEVQSLSTKLAHHLSSHGVSPESFVPFCFEKTKWTVVTILAIMKSGGVCVPLDPSHPQQRHEDIISQVNAKLVIISRKLVKQCPWLAPRAVIVDDSVSRLPIPNRKLPTVKPENAVYVIFTSGSTGTPKGVVWEHRGLASSCKAHAVGLNFVGRSRFLQFAAHVFDVSVSEMITVLLQGGCICIPSEEERLGDIASFIRKMRVDWAFLTPTLARLIKPQDVPDLKTLVLGGESIGQDNVVRWGRNLQLVITYGPAESCIYCSSNEVTETGRAETIGRAFGSNLWISDSEDPSKLAPIGTVGEILVEGPILARGYLNDNEKTNASFVVDLPWSRTNNIDLKRRFYRTGDLGRYDRNGVIDFVGRKDGQVKVRGQRLEMNEVEHKLSRIDEVKHVVVAFPNAGPYQKKLVATVELRHEMAIANDSVLTLFPASRKDKTVSMISKVRKDVWQMLPEYMIPTIWIPLLNIPKNTSGKVNRFSVKEWISNLNDETSALISELSIEKDFTQPRTPMEKELQQIWGDILNLPLNRIGIDMPFLRLGGDSISAMQVMAKCHANNIAITTQHILRHQTIEKLALDAKLIKLDPLPTATKEDGAPFKLSPIQQLHVDRAPDEDKFSQSFLLKINQEVSSQSLYNAMEVLVERHSMLRARFTQSIEGSWAQQIIPYTRGLFSYSTSEIQDTSVVELEQSIAATQERLNICNGLVFATHLFTTHPGDLILLLTAHHLVIDLVSWRVLLSELEELIRHGHISTAAPLSFQAWSRMEANYTSESLIPVLPFDVPQADYDYWGMASNPNRTCDTTTSTFSIPEEITLKLSECNKVLNTELLELLISAVTYSFAQTFPDRTIPPVFTEGHGREPWDSAIDLSRTVGWFTTMYPVFVPTQTSLIDTIRQVKDVRRSIPYNGRPYFASRVHSAQGKENFSHHFPFEILLNYSGAYQQLEREGALFSFLESDALSLDSSQMRRFELFDIEVSLHKGVLQFMFSYSTKMKHQERIGQWVSSCYATLTQIATELSSVNLGLALSDFPLISMTYSDIDKLTNILLPATGVGAEDIEDIYPCTTMQEGILVAQIKEPEKYNVQSIFCISPGQGHRSGIDVPRFQSSWQSVIRRHAILRTVFVEGLSSDGLFQQVVLKTYKADVFNLECDTEKDAMRLLAEYPLCTYSELQPPYRLGICKVQSGAVYCRLEISHVLNDAMSSQAIYRDLAQLYNGYDLSDTAPSYKEYVSYCISNPISASDDYWSSYLRGVKPCHLPLLEVHLSNERKVLTVNAQLSVFDTSLLRKFCIDAGLTPANVFQAAWAMVLRTYTGEDDVCFGYVSSGRELPIANIQDIVGPLINMLVCRSNLPKEKPILEVIQQMQEDHISSLSHQRSSLAKIQNTLQVSKEGLFNSAMSVQKVTPTPITNPNEASIEQVGGYDPTEFDIMVNVADLPTCLDISINYLSHRLSEMQAQRIINTFTKIISSVVSTPSQQIGNIDPLSDFDKSQINSWHQQLSKSPVVEECIHEAFAERAKLHPDTPAIISWDGELTYSQLDDLSTRLGHYLASIGVKPETIVPLLFEKSTLVVVSILAVLKAGGSCVTLDVLLPPQRIQGIIQVTKTRIMLTSAAQQNLVTDLAESVESVVIDHDFIRSLPLPAGTADINPACSSIRPDTLAFVVFTSGSTGTPKGVMLEHKTVCVSARIHADVEHAGPEARYLQFSAFSFDVYISDIFVPLLCGGCVCIPTEEERRSDLAATITRLKVTHATLTPTIGAFFTPKDVPTLKTLNLGGEALTKENIATWAKHVHLLNVYGPSETSNYVSTSVTDIAQPANLGRADGLNVWLVDVYNSNRLAPIGCIGELYVEGPTLSRGYLNDPAKTEESFIINPPWIDNTWEDANTLIKPGRVYRTGDIVRYNSEGTFVYVGRKDSQIKIRGQRLEIGEIEHHLLNIKNVKNGFIDYPKSGPCSNKLVAVITVHGVSHTNDNSVLSIVSSMYTGGVSRIISEIHNSLSDKLSAWMMPNVWIVIEEMPVSASLKLDRSRLRNWLAQMSDQTYDKISQLSIDTLVVAPTTILEKQIQEIWSEVLNISEDKIGVQKSFLRLGGDSITAMQVIAKCRTINIVISVPDILRNLTISQLAVRAQSVKISKLEVKEEYDAEFQLSPIQILHLNRGSGGDKFSQSILLRVKEDISSQSLQKALEILVERHSMLRAAFTKSPSGEWSQKIKAYAPGLFFYRCSEALNSEDIGPLINETKESLDFCGGHVFAAHLFNTLSDGPILFLAAHHLVMDLVSWRIILSDLEESLRQGRISAPRPLPFQTWSRMQLQHAGSIRPADSLPFQVPTPNYAYWGMADRPNLVCDTICKTFSINPETTSTLVDECNRPMRTNLIELLLSAISFSFARVFVDRTVPAIYNEGHGREPWDSSIDLSRTVGWFTTMYPVVVPTKDTIGDTIKTTKDIRRTIPSNGWTYFTSHLLTSEGRDMLAKQFPFEVLLNYSGSFQQLERSEGLFTPLSDEISGPRDSPQMSRFELFGIEAVIDKGSLRFDFNYNIHMKHQDRIQEWIKQIKIVLEQMATELVSAEPELTLTDFPLLPSISYADIHKLTTEILPQIGIKDIQDIEDIYPCTPIQEGMLVAQIKEPQNYNVQNISHVLPAPGEQRINVERLQSAWQTVVNRHAILRTIFVEGVSSTDGLFQQIVLKSSKAAFFHLECSNEQDALRLLQGYDSIDFTELRPSHRFGICEATSSGDVYFRLEISHALIDAFSTPIIMAELAQAYANTLPNSQGPLYADYVSYIQSQPLDESLEFWKNKLAGLTPSHFPVLDGSENQPVSRTETKDVQIPFVDAATIHAFCEENSITPSTLLQFVWSFVLKTYTQKESVCFGYLSAGRDLPVHGIENAVGPFINMLVSHTNFVGDDSVMSVLRNIHANFVDSLPHQICSLASIQHELNPDGSTLFNTAMSIQRRSDSASGGMDNSSIQVKALDGQDPNEYNIVVAVYDSEEALDISILHTDYLTETAATRIAHTFSKVLSSVTASPNQMIKNLDPLSAYDISRIQNWHYPYPEGNQRCLHEAFTAQALARPKDIAISSWDGELTYAELDDLSNRFGYHLATSKGIKPEVIVPLCFDKSIWSVVSMLSVLKAGGACVNLDVSHPLSRMQNIILEVNAHVMLAGPTHHTKFGGFVDTVIAVDKAFVYSLATYNGPSSLAVKSNNLAFVVFTSGSSGKPKGIMLEHQTVNFSCRGYREVLDINPDSRLFQFSAYAFDVHITEVFMPLIYGACLCMPSEFERKDQLGAAIHRFKSTHIFLTPTVATVLEPKEVPTLKKMLLGGEALSKENLLVWADKLDLFSVYGPSETSNWVSTHRMVTAEEQPANLGRGVDIDSWIIDPEINERLVPIGCVGELCVAGPSLSRGYINDPVRTEEAFGFSPPWAIGANGIKHNRVYRTGDLVRYNSDGTYSYIGRLDSQIKIRGQRLELSEVEHHLVDAPGVKYGVVAAPKSGPCAGRLVAVMTLHHFAELEAPKALRVVPSSFKEEISKATLIVYDYTAEKLPSWMVPTVWIIVEDLPLSASGKLDRKTIRKWVTEMDEETFRQVSQQFLEASILPPTTHEEKELQRLWSDILNISPESIGSNSSFLRLGGDSIGAMKLVAAVRRETSWSLTVADVFRQSTLAAMVIAATSSPSSISSIQTIAPYALIQGWCDDVESLCKFAATQCDSVEPEDIQDIYPSTSLQEGLLALSVKKPGTYVARYIFSLPVHLDIEKFKLAWDHVVSLYPILRTRLIATESFGTLQIVTNHRIIWHATLPGETLEAYLQQDKEKNMALGTGLCRFAIVAGHFVITAHHAVYDGWSLPALIDDVTKIYLDKAIPDRKPFNHFINYLRGIEQSASDKYWASQLAGAKSTVFPRLPTQSYQPIGSSTIVHEMDLARKKNSNFTTSTLLKAAWALVVARYTDETDVTFGVTVSGRSAPVEGIDGMIGTTIATVPIRVKLDNVADRSASQLLEQIQQQSFDMIPFEQVGLQEIGKLSPEARAACRFQNRLIVQPQGADDTQFKTLEIESVDEDGENFHTYAITLDCILLETGVSVTAVFDESVVDAQQMTRILHLYENVIRELEKDDATIDNIAKISVQDQQEIVSWHEPLPLALERCIHEDFTRQALAQPQAPAISSWEGELTYAELDSLSDRFAFELVRLGITLEVVVPLCFDKSLWVVVSMLAILKAGGACMTLDTSHPAGRMRDMCRGVQPRVILTAPEYSERWLSMDSTVIVVDEQYIRSLPSQNGPACTTVRPENLSFLIFTSGSTGKPKAIMLEHKSVCTSSRNHAKLFDVGPGSRCLQFSAFAFDVYISDIFTALMYGACVCVPSEEERRSDMGLSSAINRLQASHAYLTPTVATWFQPDDVPTLKNVALGGEPLTRENISTWASKVYLVNVYGPSETSNWVSYKVVDQNTKQPGNIGSGPCTNSWLVDPNNPDQLAPIGCVGEIYVESPTLSRGYLNDPARTAESFIINPPWAASQSSQRRMYRTGDLVCYNSDGTFYFVGRKDSQLKVRGQRLELGEAQHCISEAENVRHCFVEFQKTGPCAGKLVAVVSLHDFSGQDSRILQILPAEHKDQASKIISTVCDFVSDKLPAWMVPTIWIVVEELPMSASGKLDRSRLRGWLSEMTPETFNLISELFVESLVTEPATPTEKLLQEIWSSVLQIDSAKIGGNSSFLRLGGDSISAMQLISRCHKSDLLVTAYDILRGCTISELATKLDSVVHEQGHEETYSTKLSLEAISPELMDAIRSQARHESPVISELAAASDFQVASLTQQMLRHHGNLNYYIFDINGPLDIDHLESCCQLLVKKHPILRSMFVAHRRSIQQVVLENVSVKFSRLSGNKEACYSIIQEDQRSHFSLGDIFTAFFLIEEDSHHHSLIVRLAHAVYDGVSISKVFSDLKEVYAGRSMADYSDFSPYLRYKDSLTEKSKTYWRNYLQGATMTKFLSRPRPSYKDFGNCSVHKTIPLVSLSKHGITTANIIKGAWALCLAQLTGKSDVVFGELVNGRGMPVPGIDNMIGVTISNLPVRVQLDGSLTVLDLLRKIQERQLESMPFESFGFNEIVEQCTDWPGWIQFGSIITHDNIAMPHKSFSTSQSEWNLREVYGNGNDEADIGVVSTSEGDSLSIGIAFCNNVISAEFMNEVLGQLCNLIECFGTNPQAKLPDYSAPLFGQRIPLPHAQGTLSKKLVTSTRSENNILSVVQQVWESVLRDEEGAFTLEQVSENTPFYNVWGKLIAAAQFSFAFRQRGFNISMEEVIEHPTIRLQVDLCVEKSGAIGLVDN
ncbi:hypothetical protein B0O99DRAFT_695320 [Bisporella sp. PMI_857]|nr:hypothetical protein B0O99DRAFT_695320 [Bisporella sp. PMI_857]